jgi:hypothetical protein
MGLPPKPSPALPPPSEEDCARLLDAIASAGSISPQTAAIACATSPSTARSQGLPLLVVPLSRLPVQLGATATARCGRAAQHG